MWRKALELHQRWREMFPDPRKALLEEIEDANLDSGGEIPPSEPVGDGLAQPDLDGTPDQHTTTQAHGTKGS